MHNTKEDQQVKSPRIAKRGFFIAPVEPDMIITVENAGSGYKLKVFENGMGGYAAEMKNGHIYMITGKHINGTTIGFFVSIWDDTFGEPFNFFSHEQESQDKAAQ